LEVCGAVNDKLPEGAANSNIPQDVLKLLGI
jgi:hypothetical protein